MRWADYVITHVREKEGKYIHSVRIHKHEGNKLVQPQMVLRTNIISAIERGFTVVTAMKKEGKFHRGDDVGTVNVRGVTFIRTDGNKVEEDNLGSLPEF